MHFGNPEIDKLGPLLMVSYVSMGFFFGIITLMDEGLELALGYHAGNNLLISLLVTLTGRLFKPILCSWMFLRQMFICLPLCSCLC
jgi:membrane protease YdiL (CAAX protease family)